VLVDHFNPELPTGDWITLGDRSFAEHDLTSIGRQKSGQQIHEGGLPRSIFAKNRVNLTGQELGRNTIKGDQAAEALGRRMDP
jgi:hypothetical protein